MVLSPCSSADVEGGIWGAAPASCAIGKERAGGPSDGYHGHDSHSVVGAGAAEGWQQPAAVVGVDTAPAWQDCGGCGGSGSLLRLRRCPGRGLAHMPVVRGEGMGTVYWAELTFNS